MTHMLPWRTWLMSLIALDRVLFSSPMQAQPSNESARPDVRLENGQFVVEARPFLVRGIHYGPWRPGTGPNKHYPYPKLDDIAADFALIRRTGANTVLIYDPPGEVLDLAQQHGLKVVYCLCARLASIGGANQPRDHGTTRRARDAAARRSRRCWPSCSVTRSAATSCNPVVTPRSSPACVSSTQP